MDAKVNFLRKTQGYCVGCHATITVKVNGVDLHSCGLRDGAAGCAKLRRHKDVDSRATDTTTGTVS